MAMEITTDYGTGQDLEIEKFDPYLMSEAVKDFSSSIIQDFIEEHESKVAKFAKLEDLYIGNHDIIYRQREPNKPNNRLVNDYYGQIIDTVVGYFIGKPVTFNVEDEVYDEALKQVFLDNHIEDLNMELVKEFSIKGMAAVLVYQDEDGKTRLAQLPPDEVVFIYDSSKTDKLRYVLRYYTVRDVISDVETKHVEIYSDRDVSYWVQAGNKGEYVLDHSKEGGAVQPHIFGEVPVVPFYNNRYEMGDFEKIVTLVEDFNKVLSDASNEHEAYRRAYLVLKNMSVGSDTLERLKQEGIIEVDEDGDAKFLTKDLPTNAVTAHLERLDKQIYKFARVPNLDDEEFAGNLSGVAIKFKLFGLETKCIEKERKMTKGLRQLLRLITVPLNIKYSKAWDANDIEIIFKRNIPPNIMEQATIVSQLQGILDTQTLLSLLPFIDDPATVMERMEEEGLLPTPDREIEVEDNSMPEVPEDDEGEEE